MQTTPTRNFPILFVLDPRTARQPNQDCSQDAEWMEVLLPTSQYEMLVQCQELEDFFYEPKGKKPKTKEGMSPVIIHELVSTSSISRPVKGANCSQAYLALSWDLREEISIDVSFLQWEAFRDILLEADSRSRDSISTTACAIIGGIDFNMEFE
jgi:hypothetical protein